MILASETLEEELSQSLFYWITYSYHPQERNFTLYSSCLNPYFIGLPILII